MPGTSIPLIWDPDLAEPDYRSLSKDDLSAASGSPASPSIVQGTDGASAERLATFAEQQDQTTELEGIRAEQATAAKQDTTIAALRTVKALDLLLSGGQWIVQLESAIGTPITSTTVGSVAVGASGEVTFPLDLVDLGGSVATEIRVFGDGTLKLVHASPANASFPVAAMAVEDGEVIAQRIDTIYAIGAGITRISISWGG